MFSYSYRSKLAGGYYYIVNYIEFSYSSGTMTITQQKKQPVAQDTPEYDCLDGLYDLEFEINNSTNKATVVITCKLAAAHMYIVHSFDLTTKTWTYLWKTEFSTYSNSTFDIYAAIFNGDCYRIKFQSSTSIVSKFPGCNYTATPTDVPFEATAQTTTLARFSVIGKDKSGKYGFCFLGVIVISAV